MKENVNKSAQQTYVYMVMCEDESIYTGIARDVKARMKEHFYKTGKSAKYTRSRGVKRILMVWEAKSYSSAARLEYAIKRVTRKNKLFLINKIYYYFYCIGIMKVLFSLRESSTFFYAGKD